MHLASARGLQKGETVTLASGGSSSAPCGLLQQAVGGETSIRIRRRRRRRRSSHPVPASIAAAAAAARCSLICGLEGAASSSSSAVPSLASGAVSGGGRGHFREDEREKELKGRGGIISSAGGRADGPSSAKAVECHARWEKLAFPGGQSFLTHVFQVPCVIHTETNCAHGGIINEASLCHE